MHCLRTVVQTVVVAAFAATALAAPPQVTTRREGGGTSTTITQTETSGDGTRSSRRQITITRRSSSGKRPASSSAAKKAAYKVGEKVKVDWGNRIETAEVVGFSRTGWIKVRFERHGIEMTPTLPPDDVWRVPKTKTTAADAKLRNWSSKSGKYKVQAKFVELDDEQVTLEKEDGETVTLSLSKLSDADQELARRLAE